KKEEGRRKKEEGRRKKEEGRRKKEEGRRKKEEEPPPTPPKGGNSGRSHGLIPNLQIYRYGL
ncbi:MAG: hypothetical protein EAZ78_03035, partial [Oscillatoriales cyanobacterium]